MPHDVTILRDEDGIAHVRAGSLSGALFGQGYAATADRLTQMELDRRRACGRLAEIVGSAGLPSDVFHLRAGLAAAAPAAVAELDDETRAALDAYAAGVNARLAEVRAGGDLPPELATLAVEPEDWEPWHSLAVYQVRHLLMGTYVLKRWRSALVRNLGPARAARLWPSEPGRLVEPGHPAVLVARDLPVEAHRIADVLAGIPESSAGSNNVVVAAARTATGGPLLAGDPHRALDLPNVYWQNHLTCPEVDTIGLSFPGVPGFPHFGHNADVAWCITHGMADDQDVFLEEVRSGATGGLEHRHGDRWLPCTTRSHTITVRGAEPVTIDVHAGRHGPLVAGPEGGYALALAWTAAAAADTTFDALVPMLRARSVGELDEALRPWVVPVNNVLSADRAGHIRYRLRGRLARRDAANGWSVVPGWDERHDWQGFVAYDDLPSFEDPGCGYLVTANNRVCEGGPYITGDFAHPARAERLSTLVEQRDDWTADDLVAALGDTRSLAADRFVDGFVAAETTGEPARTCQEVLARWDRRMDVDSAGAAAYAACRVALAEVVVDATGIDHHDLGAFGPGLAAVDAARLVWSRLVALAGAAEDDAVAAAGGWPAAYTAALAAGAARLVELQGPDPAGWRWGALHRAAFTHPLAALRPDLADRWWSPPPVEVGGDSDCVRASGLAPPGLAAVTGSVARYVFDLADWERSRWIVPHGVSGDPRSPHHLDQLDDWAAVRTRPMRYSAAAVDASVTNRIGLTSGFAAAPGPPPAAG